MGSGAGHCVNSRGVLRTGWGGTLSGRVRCWRLPAVTGDGCPEQGAPVTQ
jgi:hypothetical protein